MSPETTNPERGSPRSPGSEEPQQRSPSSVDRVLSALFAVLIVAVAAVLVFSELTGPSAPAQFQTRMAQVEPVGGSYHLPVVVENVGGVAATKVDLTAELEIGSEKLTATSTIDFLAPSEEVTAVFVFPRDPRDGKTSVAVRSYVDP